MFIKRYPHASFCLFLIYPVDPAALIIKYRHGTQDSEAVEHILTLGIPRSDAETAGSNQVDHVAV